MEKFQNKWLSLGQHCLAKTTMVKQTVANRLSKSILYAGVLCVCSVLLSTAAMGQVVLDNTAEPVLPGGSIYIGFEDAPNAGTTAAQNFTTGTAVTSENVSVDIVLDDAFGTTAGGFTVQIVGETGTGPDENNVLATLTGNTDPATAGTYTYTGTVTWPAGQNLYIFCKATPSTSGWYLWKRTGSTNIATSNGYSSLFRSHSGVQGNGSGYASNGRYIFSLTVGPPPPSYAPIVTDPNSGCSSAGTYTYDSLYNGKPHYSDGGLTIGWTGTKWEANDGGYLMYDNSFDTPLPPCSEWKPADPSICNDPFLPVSGCFNITSGEALSFDGTNDWVSLPNELPAMLTDGGTGTALTVEYWFKGSDLQSAVRMQNGSGYLVFGWRGSSAPDQAKHIVSTDGGTNGVAVGAAAVDGDWHHVAVTWEKNTVNGFKSYLDGNIVEQRNSADVNLPNIASGTAIGVFTGGAEYTNGILDEVRIWNVARTQAEIQASMNSGICGAQPGLVAVYSFDEGLANLDNTGQRYLLDGSGNGFTGTLQNFALTGNASNWISPGQVFTPITPTRYYVDADATTGNNDGSDWANAFTDVQTALKFACVKGSEVWVAEGTYFPTASTDRNRTFQVPTGVKLYGGFAGTETMLSQRDWVAHPTILSGDIGTVGNNADNSFRILRIEGSLDTVVIDGFSLLDSRYEASDAGILLDRSDVVISNCIISRHAGYNISALWARNGSLGMYNCTIDSCGGQRTIAFDQNNTTVVNTAVKNNGGGGGFSNSSGSTLDLFGCLVANNTGPSLNGVAFTNGGALSITNCTVAGNTGYLNAGINSSTSVPVKNSIFWLNNGGSGISGTHFISNSNIQNGYPGTGNINVDPMFQDSMAYNLKICSPSLNTGDNAAVWPSVTTDILGNPRIFDTNVDMGAFEAQMPSFIPSPFDLTGGFRYCAADGGVEIELDGSEVDVNYHLIDTIGVVSMVPGTGSPISFGIQGAGVYTAEAISVAGSCVVPMTGTVDVREIPDADDLTNIAAYVTSSTTATIGWDLHMNEDVPQFLRYREVGAPDWIVVNAGRAPRNAYILRNLIPNATYEFQVRIVCGVSTWSPKQTFTMYTSDPCSPPAGNFVRYIPSDYAKVQLVCNYEPDADNGGRLQAWYKELSASSWTIGNATNRGTVFAQNLLPSTEYEVKWRARCNSAWTNWAAVDTFTTLAAPLPKFGQISDRGEWSENAESELSTTVYPNPVSDLLYLETNQTQIQNIRIYNALGQIVMEILNPTDDILQIDVSHLANGTYWLSVNGAENQETKMIVKQ